MRIPKTAGGVVMLVVSAVIMTAIGIGVLVRIPGVWPMLLGTRAQA